MNFRSCRKNLPNRLSRAFSLIEQVVGMAVIGIAATSLYGAFSQGFAVIHLGRENLRAAQILCEKTEALRLYTLEQVTNVVNGTNFMPRTFTATFYPIGQTNHGVTYTGAVSVVVAPFATNANYGSNLYQVTYSIQWLSERILRRRTNTTLIARNGIQSYIY